MLRQREHIYLGFKFLGFDQTVGFSKIKEFSYVHHENVFLILPEDKRNTLSHNFKTEISSLVGLTSKLTLCMENSQVLYINGAAELHYLEVLVDLLLKLTYKIVHQKIFNDYRPSLFCLRRTMRFLAGFL